MRKCGALIGLVFIFLLSVKPVSADVPILVRYPYIQNVTSTSVVIVWKTSILIDSELDYGLTSDYGSVTKIEIPRTDHALTLVGLSPNKIYHYRVSGGGKVLSSDEVFKTAPSLEDLSFSFAVFGDSGDGGLNTFKTANLIKSLDPDILIHTGDINYPRGEESTFDRALFIPYKDVLKTKPIFPTLGNHDILTDNGQPYLNDFYLPTNNPRAGERYYSFDYGNAHFVSLEIVEDEPLSLEQKTWIINDLQNTTKTWKFVYFHVPPYSSSRHGSALEVRKSLGPLLEWFQVDLVFSGHDHDYERTIPIRDFFPEKSGVIYVVTGGAGDGVYPAGRSSFTAYSESAYHATYVQIDGSVLTLKAFRNDGSTMDRFTINKGVNPISVEHSEKTPDGDISMKATGSVFVCSSTIKDESRCSYKVHGANGQSMINLFIREGWNVESSAGVFKLSDSILISRDYATLSGQGPDTILQVSANGVIAIQLADTKEVVLRDFTIDGNKSIYTGTRGLFINDGDTFVQLTNLKIINTNSGLPSPDAAVGSALASSNSHTDFKGDYHRKIIARNLYLKDNIGGISLFDIYDSFFTNVTIEGGPNSESVAWGMNRAYRVSLENVRITTAGGYSMQIQYFKDLNLSNIVAEGGEVNVINLTGASRQLNSNVNLTNVIAFNGGKGSDGIDIEDVNRVNLNNVITYGNGSDGIEIGDVRGELLTSEISLTNVQSYGNGRTGLLLVNVQRGSIIGGSFINNATSYNGTSYNDSAGIMLIEGTKNIIIMGATVGDTQATQPVGIVEAKAGQVMILLSNVSPPGGAKVFFPDQKVTIYDDKNAETNSVVRSYTIGPNHFLELKKKLTNTYSTNGTVTGTPTQYYAIEEHGAQTDYNSFLFNNFTGNIEGTIYRTGGALGGNDFFFGNRGYFDTYPVAGFTLPHQQ